ncbi:hypothetical protein CANCADRAFT_96986 [Tortispora caseinolytica NRRL Y-17796]|uniref:Uroporphyrinogen decarboxylase n=1 Tax=Tortispora caseinolytica NRRL Y-17796 TaxID=767744 RepID=A0A1E4TDY0_9ASCO|nr:hypothetical protein CANCADRAFT_96986 [Tortispora caseinolytica NRRL Y-17796]
MSKQFAELKNDRILRAAKGLPVDRPPVWMMRQAGRFLPEYRKVKGDRDFFEICRDPEIASEITIQPILRYEGYIDAAIIFSDILVVPQAMGIDVEMKEGVGPIVPNPLREPADLSRVHKANVARDLDYVFKAITLTRTKLDGKVPLLGFSGGPWTLLVYMSEGGGGAGAGKMFRFAKTWLYQYPKEAHQLLSMTTDVIVEYLILQVKAGAQMLQIFESWAGELAPEEFKEFLLPYSTSIARRVKSGLTKLGLEPVPMTIFAKDAWYALEDLAQSGYDAISLDWRHDPKQARERVGSNVTLQGNLDPGVMYGTRECITRKVETMVKAFGRDRYIVNLGHGTQPSYDPDTVGFFLQEVQRVSKSL